MKFLIKLYCFHKIYYNIYVFKINIIKIFILFFNLYNYSLVAQYNKFGIIQPNKTTVLQNNTEQSIIKIPLNKKFFIINTYIKQINRVHLFQIFFMLILIILKIFCPSCINFFENIKILHIKMSDGYTKKYNRMLILILLFLWILFIIKLKIFYYYFNKCNILFLYFLFNIIYFLYLNIHIVNQKLIFDNVEEIFELFIAISQLYPTINIIFNLILIEINYYYNVSEEDIKNCNVNDQNINNNNKIINNHQTIKIQEIKNKQQIRNRQQIINNKKKLINLK